MNYQTKVMTAEKCDASKPPRAPSVALALDDDDNRRVIACLLAQLLSPAQNIAGQLLSPARKIAACLP